MEEKKGSGALFWIFVLIALAGLALLLKGPAERLLRRRISDGGSGSSGITLSVTQEKAGELAGQYLTGEYIESPSLAFDGGRVTVSAEVSVEKIIPEAVRSEYPELAMLVRMLPERENAGMTFAVSAEKGALKITPEKFSVRGYSVPIGLLPKGIKEELGRTILAACGADRLDMEITSVTAENGVITISAK